MWATIHGFTGSPAMWRPLGLSPALNLRVAGHGLTPPTGFYAETERLAHLLPARARVHLIGYSLGARLALAVAHRFPGRVASLTVIGVQPGLESGPDRAQRVAGDARWCELLTTRGIEAFVDAWQALPMWCSQRSAAADVLTEQRRVRLGHDPHELAGALRHLGLGAMPNLWPVLSELALPVRVIAGAGDAKFTAIARRAAAMIPRARLSLIEDAGHNPILERPHAVADELRN
jgi:2-succinyl-6-hydroxy-2,4-cyclohexadiene-1-carboxylate synthase